MLGTSGKSELQTIAVCFMLSRLFVWTSAVMHLEPLATTAVETLTSRARVVLLGLACAALCALATVAAYAQGQANAPATDVLRPMVAVPLQSVQALLGAGKGQDARATLLDLERKTPDRSTYESYMIERLKAAAAVALGDDAGAIAASEAALALGKASPDERRTLLTQLTGFALKLKDHDATLRWSRAYLEAGGADENIRAALVRAALAKGDCKPAVEQLAVLIRAAEQRGEKPAESQLRASVACQAKLGQDDAYYHDLERLVGHHPRKEYWGDLIARLQRKAGFSDRLLLDTFRLMRHVGAMEDADDFMSAAQLAVFATLPGEARAFLQAGLDSGALGKGPGAQSHRDLMARVIKESDVDKAQLAEAEKQALAASDGRRLILVGQAAWSYGQNERAAKLMEQGVAKGVSRHPHDARLHQALVLASAGKAADARQILGELPSQDGLADLARLWLIALR